MVDKKIMAKLNWSKTQNHFKMKSKGVYKLESEADHILNSDNYWKKRLKKKKGAKKFFKKWEKETNQTKKSKSSGYVLSKSK